MKIRKGTPPEAQSTDVVWPSVGYLRQPSPQGLPPEAMRDLEAYVAHLRSYYGIPEGQPVFPKRPARQGEAKRTVPSRPATNHRDHPWRGSL